MRVLHAAAELYPWVKSGGLGDVTAALPPALAALGIDTRVVLPGFTGFLDAFAEIADVARLATPFDLGRVRLVRARPPKSDHFVYLVDHPTFYDRPGSPYAGADGRDWPDNHRRFGLFGWVAAALAHGADPGWRPDILQAHDWHAGLAPAYLEAWAGGSARPAASIFTIHNLAYQGFFPASDFSDLALPPEFFSINGVEFFGGLSFLKAGLFYADRLTTVSPTYAREIETPEFGVGLDGLLRSRDAALSGILNGVDPQIWNPQTDQILPHGYGMEDLVEGKRAAKAALQSRFGLDAEPDRPLFGAVSRLTPQKGLDLLLAAVPGLVTDGGQMALLGSGDADLERGFAAAGAAYRGTVGVELGYDEALAHLVIAGADIVLVPSRFEPCGLTQLYALRYGSLPLVRRVGGLADTVVPADAVTLADGTATGFAFDEPTPEALLAAAAGARAIFGQHALWRGMMRRAMSRDFSWAAAARRYADLYRELAPQAAVTRRGSSRRRSPLRSR